MKLDHRRRIQSQYFNLNMAQIKITMAFKKKTFKTLGNKIFRCKLIYS